MKRIALLLFLLPLLVWGQPFTISNTSITYGQVVYGNIDSSEIVITNTLPETLHVTGMELFSVYQHQPFFVKDSIFTIAPNATHNFWVYFEPEQNIVHNMNLVLKTDYRGDYLISLSGDGEFANTYYDGSFNKNEEALKSALKSITGAGYQQLSYTGARDNMYGSVDNVNGDVTCVYTARTATFNTRAGATSNNFNCEHTFPQGFFSQSLPMRSDIHHLFSTDMTANSQRGNLKFGEVSGNPTWSNGGSKKGNNASNQQVFEPRDDHKGAVARALFYFVIRYQDYAGHVASQEAVLRNWYSQYSPSNKEIVRNNDIYAIQNNRNPFVDYPQFIKRITRIAGNSTPVENKSIMVSRDTIDMEGELNDLIYTLSIVNNGNQDVMLSNFNISNTTNFEFANPLTQYTLAPNEGIMVEVLVKPTISNSVVEFLTFDTDIPNAANYEIVLKGAWTSLGIDETEIGGFQMYPNPAEQLITVEWNQANFNVRILNQVGQVVASFQNVSNKDLLPINYLLSGFYMLEVSNENGRAIKSFIVK